MTPGSRIAVATVSEAAARAGADLARRGGNAVDAGVGAALAAVVTHPAMCSLGGGGFLTVWPAGGEPVTVDGGLEMPGRGLDQGEFGGGAVRADMSYAGGVTTLVGAGSVATPGLLAACDLAVRRYGRLSWAEVVGPSLELVRDGFPMPAPSHAYLTYAHEAIYDRDPRSRAALCDDEGELLEPGETVRVEGLVETLEVLARQGVRAFYEGELGRRISEHVRSLGGILTPEDLAAYRATVRRPLGTETDGWRVATSPPPAVGGAVLAALLALTRRRPTGSWTAGDVAHLVRCQRAVLAHREQRLDVSEDLPRDVARLLAAAATGNPDRVKAGGSSGATLQASAVDGQGTACSVTLSDGYGSGVMPPGTGLWLNNCLGEEELNPRGFHGLEPGTRLISNMAPTVVRSPDDGRVLALGSPGSERIPVVIHQVLVNRLRLGMSLRDAIEHPRCHVRHGGRGLECVTEPGLPLDEVPLPARRYPERAMYFGGVAAAEYRPSGEGPGRLDAAADPRRSGGTARIATT